MTGGTGEALKAVEHILACMHALALRSRHWYIKKPTAAAAALGEVVQDADVGEQQAGGVDCKRLAGIPHHMA